MDGGKDGMFQSFRLTCTVFYRKVCLLAVAALMIAAAEKAGYSQMNSLISPCASGNFITIDSLQEYCGSPGVCGNKLLCEGHEALIQGYVDYNNVFERSTYPMLPYQKFLITNQNRTRTIEVWVNPEGSELVFNIIAERKSEKSIAPVFVRGMLSGFDMPVMGKCLRDIKLVLTGAASISYTPKEHNLRFPQAPSPSGGGPGA